MKFLACWLWGNKFSKAFMNLNGCLICSWRSHCKCKRPNYRQIKVFICWFYIKFCNSEFLHLGLKIGFTSKFVNVNCQYWHKMLLRKILQFLLTFDEGFFGWQFFPKSRKKIRIEYFWSLERKSAIMFLEISHVID